MKAFRPWFTVLPATALVLSGCEKKEQQSAPAAPGEVAQVPGTGAPEAAVPAVKALTPGERAAMLGIVAHLSKDTESVMALYDGKDIVKRLKSLKTWEFIREVAKEEGGADPEEEMAEGAEMAGKFLGQEMFIATGKGTGTQLENLFNLQHRINYYQFRFLTKSFTDRLKGEDARDSRGRLLPRPLHDRARPRGDRGRDRLAGAA